MSEYLHLMKLAMGRHPAVNAEVRLDVLIKACTYFYEKDDALSMIASGGKLADASANPSNAIYISDLKDDPEYFTLLLVRGNPSRRLPSFVNMRDRVVKPVTKQDEGDVPGASCHVVILKAEIAAGTDQGRYRMAIERASGLSKSLARDFITTLMSRYAEEFPAEFITQKRLKTKKEKPEEIAYRPTVRFHPQLNASLKNDLESGKIGGFKLVRGVPAFRGEASASHIQRVNVRLEAQIAPTEDFAEVRRAISFVKEALAGVAFEGMNLELIDELGGTHNTRMMPIDQIEEDDMRYCKTIQIEGLSDVGSECYADIQLPIVTAARKAVSSPTNWTSK